MTSFSTTSTSNTSHSTSTNSKTSSSSRLSNSSQPTVNSACAACRYQRRKCKPDCILAPFFPANNQQKFLNAHRLFGVSNINKIIANLDPYQRTEAMHTIIFQSDMRAHDPVGGCYHYIRELERQLEHDTAELELVLRQLAVCRAQAAAATAQQMAPPDMDQVNPNLLLNAAAADDAGNVIYDHGNGLFPSVHPQQQQHEQQQYYNYLCYDGSGMSSRDQNNSVVVQNGDNLLSLQQQQHHHHCVVEDEDVKPLVDMFEVRTLIGTDHDEGDSKNDTINCEVASHHRHSSTSSDQLKNETTNQVPEHDLKSAASLFTLTNCTSSSAL